MFSTEEREDFNDNKDDDKQDDNDFVYEDDDHLSSHDQWQQSANWYTIILKQHFVDSRELDFSWC